MTDPRSLHPAASQLLHDATDDLTADVDLIVRGGIARGRTIRRRRRVGTSLVAAAVVGVIGVAASVGPGLVGDDRTAIDPAGPAATASAATPSAPVTTDVPDAVVQVRDLAVTQAEIPAVFATIVPGDVTELPQSEVNDDAPIVDFLWEGASVRVGITREDYAGPEYTGTPQERCAIARDNDPGAGDCGLRDDGTAVLTSTSTGPRVDGGITTSSGQAFTTDGWDVLVMASNATATKDAPLVDDVPLLSREQLLEAATSPRWFSGS